MRDKVESAIERFKSIFRKDQWEERFLVGKKKAKKILEKLKKQGRNEMTTESMELLEYYGVPVADYKVVVSKREIYQVVDEMGLPVVIKSVTSRAVHRGDIGAVCLIEDKGQIEEAYPQVLGEVASRMPWVALTGIMVQEYLPGHDKCWLRIERDRKANPFKVWWKRIVGGKQSSSEKLIEGREDMESVGLEEEFAGVFAFALQFKEVQKLEADFVRRGDEWVLVDSKVWLFD